MIKIKIKIKRLSLRLRKSRPQPHRHRCPFADFAFHTILPPCNRRTVSQSPIPVPCRRAGQRCCRDGMLEQPPPCQPPGPGPPVADGEHGVAPLALDAELHRRSGSEYFTAFEEQVREDVAQKSLVRVGFGGTSPARSSIGHARSLAESTSSTSRAQKPRKPSGAGWKSILPGIQPAEHETSSIMSAMRRVFFAMDCKCSFRSPGSSSSR